MELSRRNFQFWLPLPDVAVGFVGVALWLFTHPFLGLSNDGALYALMALNWLHPDVFSSDLFVRFGSQDQFSIFSPLYGWLVGRVGFAAANISLLLAAYGLWLVGAAWLASRLTKGWLGRLAFLLLCAIAAYYGGWSVLYAGENFLTSRPIAEALCLLGLAALAARKVVSAVLLLGAALAFHPLMALSGVGVAFIFLALRRPVMLLMLPVAALVGLGLALAGVEPFSRLLVRMDAGWFSAVNTRDTFVFPSNWESAAWLRLGVQACIFAALMICSSGWRRSFFAAIAVVGFGGVALSFVGGDLLRSALLIQLQTWRFAWLISLVTIPGLVLLFVRLRHRPNGVLTVLLLSIPAVIQAKPFQLEGGQLGIAMAIAGLALVALTRRGSALPISLRMERALIAALLILAASVLVSQFIYVWVLAQNLIADNIGPSSLFEALPFRLALLVVGCGIVALTRLRPFSGVLAALLLLTIAGTHWDQRSSWTKYVMSGVQPSLSASLEPTATVFWQGGGATETWLLLRRPAYVSYTQASGLLFSRATALEWSRRQQAVGRLLPFERLSASTKPPSCAIVDASLRLEEIAAICRRAAGLDGVVLTHSAAGLQETKFYTPVPREIRCVEHDALRLLRQGSFFYQSCAVVRGSSAR
jgi:hypothetical protein